MIEEEEDMNADRDLVYNVRVSNQLFTRLVIAQFCSLFFGILGLLLSIIVYELRL